MAFCILKILSGGNFKTQPWFISLKVAQSNLLVVSIHSIRHGFVLLIVWHLQHLLLLGLTTAWLWLQKEAVCNVCMKCTIHWKSYVVNNFCMDFFEIKHINVIPLRNILYMKMYLNFFCSKLCKLIFISAAIVLDRKKEKARSL